jgi:hypothetical protein
MACRPDFAAPDRLSAILWGADDKVKEREKNGDPGRRPVAPPDEGWRDRTRLFRALRLHPHY